MVDAFTALVDNDPVTNIHRCNFPDSAQKHLSTKILSALEANYHQLSTQIDGWSKPDKAVFHNRHTVRGIEYTTRTTSMRDSAIFFSLVDGNNLVPGFIQDIFSVPIQRGSEDIIAQYFFVIKRYLPLSAPFDNPFLLHTDFGAELWSDRVAEDVEVVPTYRPICHSIGRKWDTEILVLKPLDKAFGKMPEGV
jgi:hypothetical protein